MVSRFISDIPEDLLEPIWPAPPSQDGPAWGLLIN
jgi:hypothetical protein